MEINEKLICIAAEMTKNSYCPYSNFKVGAALLTDNYTIYTGCNIENASYSATNCAERTAIFKAVSEGETKFKKIAIVSSSNDLTFPCGVCLQVMNEFMPDGEIILQDCKKEIKVYKLKDFLPYSFGNELIK